MLKFMLKSFFQFRIFVEIFFLFKINRKKLIIARNESVFRVKIDMYVFFRFRIFCFFVLFFVYIADRRSIRKILIVIVMLIDEIFLFIKTSMEFNHRFFDLAEQKQCFKSWI